MFASVPLGKIAEITSSKRIYLSDYVSEGIPFFRSKEIIERYNFESASTELFISEKKFQEIKNRFGVPSSGDILLTSVGTLGIPYLVNDDDEFYFKDGNLIWFKNFKDTTFSKFIFYWICSEIGKNTLLSYSIGSSQPAFTIENLKKASINLPSLEAQRKIAAILSAYDDLIENNKRRIALLEQMAEEIYREWFVRMRFPGHENTRFEKGAPASWHWKPASHFFSVVKGKSYGRDEISDDPESLPFVTLKSFFRGGGYRADGLKKYSGKYKEDQLVHKGDVVMAVTDMTQNREVIGRVARLPDFGETGAVISLDVVKLVPNQISKTFLYSYMRHSGYGSFIKEFANGANVLHLKPDLITKQSILIPPEELRQRFDRLIEPVYNQMDILSLQTHCLTKSRDQLLPRLISGKFSVEDLDIQFPPSMQELRQ